MKNLHPRDEKGMALTIVIVITLIIVLLAGYILNLSYNKTRLVNTVGVKRTRTYYRAQAGVVDAFWRIRVNKPAEGAGSFKDPAFAPPPYFIDIDTNTVTADRTAASDVEVIISPMDDATKIRRVESIGFGTN